MNLLSVEGFTLTFRQYARGLRRRRLEVISGLDLDVDAGELVAVVGSSGSGKSLLANALLGLVPSNAVEGGRITYGGSPWIPAAAQRCAVARSRSSPVRDPHRPAATVGAQAQRAADLAGIA